jgi:hypothetical protein
MAALVDVSRYAGSFAGSALAPWGHLEPWHLVGKSSAIVRELLATLPTDEFDISDELAVHRGAVIELGAVLKGPLIVGAGCFVAAGAYVRGGNWVAERCILGPGAELKSSFVFGGTKLAHFTFVGDSVLGEDGTSKQEASSATTATSAPPTTSWFASARTCMRRAVRSSAPWSATGRASEPMPWWHRERSSCRRRSSGAPSSATRKNPLPEGRSRRHPP